MAAAGRLGVVIIFVGKGEADVAVVIVVVIRTWRIVLFLEG